MKDEREDGTMGKKRYAIVGLGARSAMYSTALWETYRDHAELVAFCDINETRMAYYNRIAAERYDLPPVPTYRPEDFARMLDEERVDTVIVTSVDRTHHRYIICGDGGGLRRDHREADDDRRGEMPGDPRHAGAHGAATDRRLQLPLRSARQQGEGAPAVRRDRQSPLGPLRVAAGHAARRGLFPPLAPRQAQLGRPDGPQGNAPLRPGQLVAGLRPGDRLRLRGPEVLRARECGGARRDSLLRARPRQRGGAGRPLRARIWRRASG